MKQKTTIEGECPRQRRNGRTAGTKTGTSRAIATNGNELVIVQNHCPERDDIIRIPSNGQESEHLQDTESLEEVSTYSVEETLPDTASNDSENVKSGMNRGDEVGELNGGESIINSSPKGNVSKCCEDIKGTVLVDLESQASKSEKISEELCETENKEFFNSEENMNTIHNESKDLQTIVEEVGGEKSKNGKQKTEISSTTIITKDKTKKDNRRQSVNNFDVRSQSARNIRTRHSFSSFGGRMPFKEIQDTRRSFSATGQRKTKGRSDPFRFTKKELEWYLPRKSFFDCHDKTLKDAGRETDEELNRLEMRKQRVMEKLRRERELREKNKPAEPITEEKPTNNEFTNDSTTAFDKQKETVEDEDDVVIAKLEEAQTLAQKPVRKSRHKRKGDEDDDVHVEYAPLLHYLKYVKEHPEDFYAHKRQNSHTEHVGIKATPWIIRLAEITERRNKAAARCSTSDNILVEAVKDIRPRFTDPGQWTMSQKEKALLTSIGSRKDPIFAATKQEPQSHDTQSQEDGKSDFEKEKLKLDKWLKTVSTAGLQKAKELALREFGEEDKYHTKWWSTLQTCSYLRQKGLQTN